MALEDIVPGGFDPADAVALTWQNLIPLGNTNQAVELHPQDIDTLIRLAGRSETPEPVLYLTLHADTAGGMVQTNNASRWTQPRRDFRPRWRSMVTSLSPTGVDLSRDDFLEFWLFQPPGSPADAAGLRLVVDIGTVSEDALAIAPDSFTVNGADTVFSGRQYVGQGVLNTERTDIGIFNADVDDIGILGDRPDQITEVGAGPVENLPLCNQVLTNAVAIFPWGDLSSRCTRGNGQLDTEDLNGDGVLDADGPNENVFRYVVNLANNDFFVRDGVPTKDQQGNVIAVWKLYRIPIRQPTATLNTPTLRLAKHLRLTLATPPDNGDSDIVARVAMARLRFVGSPWVRRSETPIAGLAGITGLPTGSITTSVVSTENSLDLGYTSPPGITDNVSRQGGDRETSGTQINEKSLRIIATQLGVDQRAEAYLRFPAGPQNLLTYRTLKVWFRGRGPGWEEGDLQAFIKLGSDNDNFYLYRTAAKSTTWEPEAVIDLETWRRLRADVENRWLSGQPPSGAAACGIDSVDTDAYVACEGPYIVNVRDPGVNPPNLAAVQEVSAGIYRVAQNVSVAESELWVDDIRLSQPVSQTGLAGSIDARFTASDVGSFAIAYVKQNGQFRQINQDPSYRGTDVLQLASNVRLDRFLPASFGLAMPFTITYARTGTNPELLTGTDLRAASLPGLRKPESWSATYSLSIRRESPGQELGDPWPHRPAAPHRNEYPGAKHDRPLERRGEVVRAATRHYLLQMRRHGFRLPLGGLVEGTSHDGCAKAMQERDSREPTSASCPPASDSAVGSVETSRIPRRSSCPSLEATTPSFSRHWR